jgi:tetrahydromethanopterin S-methyltransferase subunit G
MNWTTIIVSAMAAFGSTMVGRAAKRTPRQEKRDDFEKVTQRLDKDIERLEGRISRQDTQISGQTSAIGYLSGWVRTLVLFTRAQGLEPPAPPFVPDDAKPYLHNIGV